jgi:hypothetical protein
VKRRASVRLALTACFIISFAVVALGIAAPPGADGAAQTSLYAGGHPFGIGEQQVYLIDRESTLAVRWRNHDGDLTTKTFHYHARTSVAWTIEGLSSAGGPVLGVATAAPTPSGTTSPAAPLPSPLASPPSPSPSPTLDAHGAGSIAPGSALAEFAPASILLSSVESDLPDIGKPWPSTGEVWLPFGAMTIDLSNEIMAATGDQDANVAQIASTGTTDFRAKVKVAGFGTATLRGTGSATSTSFLETQNRLLLGMALTANSHGNAAAGQQHGTYDVGVKIAIKLYKFVPGIPPFTGSPGFVPASGYLGETTAPDTGIYATAVPDKVSIPAATDTGYVPPPAGGATPYQSALPEMSLPPIPLPMASDQPAASPPAAPTPTPQPTHY